MQQTCLHSRAPCSFSTNLLQVLHTAKRLGVILTGLLRRKSLACRVVLPAYGAGPYLPAIVMERPVYVREMSDGLYSPLTYLMYKVGAPPALLQALCHLITCSALRWVVWQTWS